MDNLELHRTSSLSHQLDVRRDQPLRIVGATPLARPQTSPETPTRRQAHRLAWLQLSAWSEVMLLSACGILLVSFAHRLALLGRTGSDALFWLGLALLVLPIALRLVSVHPTPRERIALLVALGTGLYLVKLLHSPVTFTFPDEFIHLRNLLEILATQHLFQPNSILPATPFYPGLEMTTAALVNLTGLTPFMAGAFLIGAARVLILLALYLLFEQLTHSPRVAGLGALLYAANANYVFWTAQFSYESLALPLAVVLLYVLLRRETISQRRAALALTLTAFLLLFAVIATHHLTSYILVALLCGWVILQRVSSGKTSSGLALFTLIATVATFAWAFFVATPTSGYLTPVFRSALESIASAATDLGSGRELFQSNLGTVTPLWDRVLALASVGVTLLLLPFGLFALVRAYRTQSFALVLAALALCYPLTLLLRLTAGTWEISNRTSEFLFLGVSFVTALALVEFPWRRFLTRFNRGQGFTATASPPLTALGMAAIALTLVLGGVVVGWSSNARLPQPLNVQANNQPLSPQGLTAANWTRQQLGANQRIATDYVNGRFLMVPGMQAPQTGTANGIQALLNARVVDSGVRTIVASNRIRYALLDRRVSNQDPLTGFYFPSAGAAPRYLDPSTYQKFDWANLNRIYDSGDIFIYQTEGANGLAAAK